jgi:hypothetical protein
VSKYFGWGAAKPNHWPCSHRGYDLLRDHSLRFRLGVNATGSQGSHSERNHSLRFDGQQRHVDSAHKPQSDHSRASVAMTRKQNGCPLCQPYCHIRDFLGKFGGAGRDRTDDLSSAIAALSQLSYGPRQARI